CLVRCKKSYAGTAIDFHSGEHAREMEAIRQRTKRARYFFRGCQIPLHPASIKASSMNKGSRPQMLSHDVAHGKSPRSTPGAGKKRVALRRPERKLSH